MMDAAAEPTQTGSRRGAAEPSIRVLIVGHVSAPSGAEIALVRIIPDLGRHGIDVHVCLGEPGPIAELAASAGATVHLLDLPADLRDLRRGETRVLRDAARFSAKVVTAAREVAALCHRHHIDLVATHSLKALVYGSLGARLARRPLVWQVHDIIGPPYLGREARRMIRLAQAILRPVAVLVPSQVVAASLTGRGIRRPVVVPHGVAAPVDPAPIPLEGPLRLGMAARLAEWKGQAVAIAAMPRILADHPDASLALAGAPLFGETEYVSRLRDQITSLGLEAHVQLVGHVSDSFDFYRTLDIALHTSIQPEPYGLSVIEALACGRPVVASRQGGVLETLDGDAGSIMVPPGDPEALATGILTLASEGRPALRERGERAWRHAQRFDLGLEAERTAGLYHSVVRSRRR